MSYKKFLHKYLYLKEEVKDLKKQEQKNFKEFNEYFSVKEEKEETTPPPQKKNLSQNVFQITLVNLFIKN